MYDLNALKERFLFMKEAAKKSNIKILFAVKSFPAYKILDLASSYVDGFEVSNIAEYNLLPKNDCYKFISVNDPTINLEDLSVYADENNKKISYNLDSIDNTIITALQNYVSSPNLQFGIRLSHTELGIDSSDYRSGVNTSRFGIKIQEAIELIKTNYIISGIHLHNGSEANNVESYKLIANKILSYLQQNRIKIKYINFGGGLHTLSDHEILLLFREIRDIIPQNIEIIFEPGNAFCKKSGYAIAKIKNVKEVTKEKYMVTTDISYESNLKWSTPRYYPLHKINELEPGKTRYVDVAFYGSSCFEQEIGRASCRERV